MFLRWIFIIYVDLLRICIFSIHLKSYCYSAMATQMLEPKWRYGSRFILYFSKNHSLLYHSLDPLRNAFFRMLIYTSTQPYPVPRGPLIKCCCVSQSICGSKPSLYQRQKKNKQWPLFSLFLWATVSKKINVYLLNSVDKSFLAIFCTKRKKCSKFGSTSIMELWPRPYRIEKNYFFLLGSDRGCRSVNTCEKEQSSMKDNETKGISMENQYKKNWQ